VNALCEILCCGNMTFWTWLLNVISACKQVVLW
jgi:hypothetical protein